MSLPHCPFDGPPVSTSHSEPEEVASDHEGDLEDQDELDDQKNKEQDESENRDREDDRVEVCTCEEGNMTTCWKCQPSTSSRITFVGDATVTANPEFCLVDCQVLSQPENIDEIVQDHDNFGTDENDDSLDSLALATGSSCSVVLYRQDSEDSAEDDPCIFGTSKRKNNEVADQAFDSEPIVKKKKKSSVNANCSVPASDRDTKQINIDLPVPLLDKNAKVIHPFFKVQQLQEFLSGDPLVEHEVCSPQHAPANCSTTATCSKQTPIEEEIEVLPTPPSAAIVSWVETFSRWSHTDKIVAIDQLITACHPLEVRHMMNVIEPQFQRDFIALLPKELALYVLSFLEPCDLLRAAQTCRYWRILAEDNLLWREKCQEAGLSNVLETLNLKRKKTSIGGFNHSNWKSGFMRQHNIEMNWRKMPIRSPGVLKGHDDHVITCLQFSGNRIVSGSDDNTLQVWNATTGKCLKTLVGHTGGVWSSQMEGTTIISGSTDRTLKVWNADTGDCVKTLHGHTSTVRCMHLHKNKVVSGSRDATLRMWDIISGECLHVLLGHVAAVRCVQYDGKLVVSGAYDYLVKVWNPETEECLHTLSGHTNRVYSLQFDGIHIVSGSLDTSIRVWDVETGACKHALMGHQSLTSGMELRDNILVSGNADSTVKVWDIATGQCLQTLSGPNKHQSAVTSLQFNSKFVITSSDDGTVKLWDVKTGDFLRDLVALDSGGSGGVVWRIRSSATKLVCAVGSRNGTEETKLLVLDFDVQDTK